MALYDKLKSDTDYSDFVKLLDSPEYSEVKRLVSTPNCLTLFAPTNEAIAQLPTNSTPQQTMEVLSYHILPQKMAIATCPPLTYTKTICEQNDVGIQKVDTANVVCGTGTAIHIEEADTECSNGILHKIKQLLTPPRTPQQVLGDIKAYIFGVQAQRLSLMEFLDENNTNSTFFLPIDDAWNGVNYKGWNDNYMRDILRSHIVQDKVHRARYTTTFADGQKLTTVNGRQVTINKNGNNFRLNNMANIVHSNILTKGGNVVHTIDKVFGASASAGSAFGVTLLSSIFTLLVVLL